MKSPNRGAGNRGLLNHSGKGSADRTADAKSFRDNFAAIDFGQAFPVGFVITEHGSRKVYGERAEKPEGPHIRIC